jgi:hypothetical protein
MTTRLTATALALSLTAGGCITTNAHQLLLAGNPRREQAITCEKKCQSLRPPVHRPCEQAFGNDCAQANEGPDAYAACLDQCPGTMVVGGVSCPDRPVPDSFCVETPRADDGAIVGGGLVGIAVLSLVALASLVSKVWFVVLVL